MSPAEKVALIVIAVLGGSTVGLVGALLLVRRASKPPAPPRRQPPRAPAPSAPPPPPLRLHLHDPDPDDLDLDGPRDRHRELYDSAYEAQLDHLQRLRRAIGTHLAGADPSGPRDKPDS